ncbi:MAG: hypothetical protein ABIR71_09115 [Chthoniobacterales bacterium]
MAGIYAALPEAEKAQTAILAGNYGEAGALNLYGPAWHLRKAISGTNTSWWRGYGTIPPEVVILVGFSRESAERFASQVEWAGQITNRHGVQNEETRDHPDIFVCRGFKKSWPEFWKSFQRFG